MKGIQGTGNSQSPPVVGSGSDATKGIDLEVDGKLKPQPADRRNVTEDKLKTGKRAQAEQNRDPVRDQILSDSSFTTSHIAEITDYAASKASIESGKIGSELSGIAAD